MPKRVKFSVIHATGEDLKYKANELNAHGPTVKGWQSAKNCDYPQDIVLQFEKQCSLTKAQVLVHQYLIPSKIELYASNQDTNTVEDGTKICWEYLGYITLSDNQSTGFKSRELKSVSVPTCVASYLKLKLGKNHKNSHNINNQVSLIAINVLGTEVDSKIANNADSTINEKLNAVLNDPGYTSPYDDLAFEMYVDTDIANMIRDMEIKKHFAVISSSADERYEYARKLKQAMESLRVAGERLGKNELEKRHAIEMEDYERARHKKVQMEEFRAETYEQLNINQLLEIDGACPQNDECAQEPTSASEKNPTSASPLHGNRHPSPKTGSPCVGSPTSLQQRGSFRRRNKSAGAIIKSSYEQYEDKPLPALRHSQTNEFLRECQLDYDAKAASKLTEREKKQAALPILVFGGDLVEKFYSKQYCDKEDGLNKLKEELICYDNARMHTANKTGRAAVFLLHRALRDKVYSVYNLANEVIRFYFVQFVPGRVSPAEVSRSVDKLLPELLTKSGDTSIRIHHMAVHTILTMADCKTVRDLHIIPAHLSRPLNSSTHPRLALSRAEMVEQLIINHGISTDKQSGLTCRTLSEFGSSGIHHPAEPVRKVAERILVLVYKVNPRLVRKQLPPDDDITRRNLLYRQLFHEFDKIDLQKKQEMLERNRLIQRSPNCLSPEPADKRNGINKSVSSMDVTKSNGNYCLSKSVSGGDIAHRDEHEKAESGVSTPSNNSQPEEDEKHCIFCHQPESAIFTVSKTMNSHYWRACPMLVRCADCSQIVEVATLFEHLVAECENRESYSQCPRCTEPVKLDRYNQHFNECKEVAEGCCRCPLCHENLDDEENTWKVHLMGEKPCVRNSRVRHSKQVKIQI